jgi:hypothetical protein
LKALAVRRLYREPENGSCLSASDWLWQSYFSLKQNEVFLQSLMLKISLDFVQMCLCLLLECIGVAPVIITSKCLGSFCHIECALILCLCPFNTCLQLPLSIGGHLIARQGGVCIVVQVFVGRIQSHLSCFPRQ